MAGYASTAERVSGSLNNSPSIPTKFLHEFFELSCDWAPNSIALECDQLRLTYAELDARANQLAHHLRALGVGPGSRIAILLPRSVNTYESLLAIGKAGATFVPIDPGSPADRVSYIVEDAAVDLLLTVSDFGEKTTGLRTRVLELDSAAESIAARLPHRPEADPRTGDDPLAYVMYTSGSTGRPKGVQIAQSSISNFLEVVPRVYDVRPDDRVYQGMTISFDFSIEEIWPTWAVGATLVAGPNDSRRLGAELADFLEERAISVLYCVPTLLATIPRDLPRVRSILVGGEACPAPLVDRWSRPGRRILNTYGPTEATVTATWAELRPGRPVTIGVPLPTYSVVLLDEQRNAVPDGEIGEICIGGPGVANGYVGRPDLTADRFIDHASAPPGSKIYRTGDLGRMTENGEIEYHGRADTEVKIRGHRVDLAEIDNVLLEVPGVSEAAAAMVPFPESDSATKELAAYIVCAPDAADATDLIARLHEHVRDRLPAYMVPSFVDVVPGLPTMPSGKVDRNRLPVPTGRRLLGGGKDVVAPEGNLETDLRAVFAEAFGADAETLSVEADFFTELGGHSLLAARVVSLLRARDIGASLAVRDLYANPSVRELARHLDATERQAPASAPPRPEPLRHSGARIAGAGTVQALLIYVLLFLGTLPLAYACTRDVFTSPIKVIAISLLGVLLLQWLLPIALARPLAAGIKPGRYRLWGKTYLRLWLLTMLMSASPLGMLSGSPFAAVYLRLLGARIGRRTTIRTGAIGLPPLVSIGDDAAVGYGATLSTWRVQDGWVLVAPIEVGQRSFVGANAVLEAGARMEADSALGDQSVLSGHEVLPAGQRWAGSPAHPVDSLAGPVEAMLRNPEPVPAWRRTHVVAMLLGLIFLQSVQFATAVPGIVLTWWAIAVWGPLVGFGTAIIGGPMYVFMVCAAVALGKRLVLPRTPTGIYPIRSMLGVRKWISDGLFGLSLGATNSLYATLYTAPWLRLLGAKIGKGSEVSTAAHIDPDLLTLGEGSFLADMASVGPAAFAGGRMSLRPTEVGSRAFVGNAALVTGGTVLQRGSLVGVSTLAPETVTEDTSWLGSPAMNLPVRQDSGSFPEELTFRPTRKAVVQRLIIEFVRATMPASVMGLAFYAFLLTLWNVSADLLVTAIVAPVLGLVASCAVILYCAMVKRVVVGTYRPRVEPLWSLFVRRTEFVTALYETAAVPAGVGMLAGTPFMPIALRLFGARIGKRTWIGTTFLTEFDLVRVGDDVAVAGGVSLQTHLFEDRVMKMSYVTVHSGSTVDARSVVLYDSEVGTDVALGALSLVMKGEQLTSGTMWRGIPAQRVIEAKPAPVEPASVEPASAEPATQVAVPVAWPGDMPTQPAVRISWSGDLGPAIAHKAAARC